MVGFSNPDQEAIHEAVQEALNKGCSTEELVKMLAEIIVHIIR